MPAWVRWAGVYGRNLKAFIRGCYPSPSPLSITNRNFGFAVQFLWPGGPLFPLPEVLRPYEVGEAANRLNLVFR